MRECDKSKNTCKQQLPIVYMSFNNVGHLITSTITACSQKAVNSKGIQDARNLSAEERTENSASCVERESDES